MTASDVDPVTLEVLWTNLSGITQEMGSHFQQSAFSDIIKYGNDLSTSLFTGDGRLLAQGQYSPGILMGMAPALETIIADHVPLPAWEPGDVVLTNDPHIGSGHLPDFFMFAPIFVDDDLAGFAGTVGHQTDVGGSAPGSFSVYTTDIFQEGLQVPPVKYVAGGDRNEPLFETMLENSRVPEQMAGDLRAQRAALDLGKRQYRELVTEMGTATVERYVEAMFDRSETGMASAIRQIPDGTYAYSQQADGFESPVDVCVTLTVEEDHLDIDFSGSSPQHRYAINSPLNYTAAYAYLAVISALDPDVPHTYGSERPITIRAPEGSIVNPGDDAPVASRGVLNDRVLTTVNGALHEAMPGRIPAGGSEQFWQAMQFASTTRGDQAVLTEGCYGGAGAHPDRDGAPTIASGANVRNLPIEVIESVYPISITRYELRPDSAGAGRFRGGSGAIRQYEFEAPAEVQLTGEGNRFPPYGLAGGRSGGAVRCFHVADGDRSEISVKEEFSASPGDVLEIRTAGGGGYGPPDERDRALVERDLEDGLISPEYAREHHDVAPE